jgi:hypothetical protein
MKSFVLGGAPCWACINCRSSRTSLCSAAISRIRSRSIWRSSVSTNMAATEAVTRDKIASPSNTTITAKNRDACEGQPEAVAKGVHARLQQPKTHAAKAHDDQTQGQGIQQPTAGDDEVAFSNVSHGTTVAPAGGPVQASRSSTARASASTPAWVRSSVSSVWRDAQALKLLLCERL